MTTKVLIVDDSPSARATLTYLLSGDKGFEVVGTAANGVEAVAAVETLKPDVITMDIHMPRMDGATAIRQIMQTHPTPIVVVTGNEITEEIRATFQSLESGALAIVPRPTQVDRLDDFAIRQLLETVKLMSEIKVVRRWNRERPRRDLISDLNRGVGSRPTGRDFRIVAVGASTGGPVILKSILTALPSDFALPIVIVQHIAKGFVDGFTAWLNEGCALRVKVAVAEETLCPGVVYVAPEGQQLGVNAAAQLVLQNEPQTGLCPSVTFLFQTVARAYGPQAIGVLLTGMGRDGASGLLAMKESGALTIAQDKETSIVHGMPGEAIKLGAADWILPPDRIAELLLHAAAGTKIS